MTDLARRRCWWCDASYVPTQEDQRFCCALHGRRARKARRRYDEEKLMERIAAGLPLCPHPWKVLHTSDVEAAGVASTLGTGLTPYRCICGGFHLGNSQVEAEKRLIRSLSPHIGKGRRK
jgi:hypothetical protein